MNKIILLTFCLSFMSIAGFASVKYSEEVEILNFTVKNALVDGERYFMAEGEEVMDAPLDAVIVAAASFQDRCNQELKRKRKFTSKETVCKYHNPSLVESVIIKDFKRPQQSKKLLDSFLIWRNIFNKNHYSYYDYVTIEQISRDEVHIKFSMLEDNEVKKYLSSFTKRDSAFKTSGGEYFIKSLGKNKTNVRMTFFSSTDHWLLSSSMAKGKIMNNIGEGSRRTLNSIRSAVEKAK